MLMEKIAPWGQWTLLVVSSLILGFIFQAFHVPAALLLGPMIIGVLMGLLGATVRIAPIFFKIAQGILGCMIAQSLSPSILPPLLNDWPMVLLVLIATLMASGLSGWLLVKFSNLPGPTGAWGSSPGGASAMKQTASPERLADKNLEPVFTFEVQVRREAGQNHQADGPRIAEAPLQLRHELEVHPVA